MKNKWLFVMMFSCFPLYSLSQAPDLGTAASFAAFTAAGIFANAGLTVIAGDVGNNAAAVTGFPPGILTGAIHSVDAVSSQAAIDLNAAYTYLSSLPCTTAEGVSLGNGQTLTPGVYCIAAAATVSGVLILDAQGDPNAIFVFQINGTLITDQFSNVLLINSAFAGNIYWQVNGAVTLGDSSAFRGSVLASGAIDLLEGAALGGRALSIAGAVNLHTNIITITGDVTPLPIELISFSGRCDHQNVTLTWTTASEAHNNYFSVEQKLAGTDWLVAGIVDGAGNSNTIKYYSFTDSIHREGSSFYRLKQTDLDGKFVYSGIITVANCRREADGLSVYPNPGSGSFSLSFSGDKKSVKSIAVYNSTGQKLFNSNLYQPGVDLSVRPPGVYFLYFRTISKTFVKKLLIRK